MTTNFLQFDTLADLRDYVTETICNHNNLLADAFQMTERTIVRGGRPCGIYFCLHGPRAVKFTAIWETDRNQVLFYEAGGEKFHRTQLLQAPSLQRVAA